MDIIMKYCVILHNMIASELRPADCPVPNAARRVSVGEDAEICFERLGQSTGVNFGTKFAIFDVSQYLSGAHKFMRSRH